MDEDEYRAVYKAVNNNRCVFEKALNNRRCDCEKKERKLIATREAVGCQSPTALSRCTEFLNTMRQKARFSLRVVTIEGPMPHNKELQVQAGGCLQLQKILFPEQKIAPADSLHKQPEKAANIFAIVNTALAQYGSIEQFPYSEIVQGIVHYKSRPKRKRS